MSCDLLYFAGCTSCLYIRVQRFNQLGSPRLLRVAKFNSKTYLQNTFFIFLSRFARGWLQSLQKYCMIQKSFLNKCKMGIRNAEFYADFESVEKVAKKQADNIISEKVKEKLSFWLFITVWKSFRIITFTWLIFLQTFFHTDSNSASNFAFMIPISNFCKQLYFALISTFC